MELSKNQLKLMAAGLVGLLVIAGGAIVLTNGQVDKEGLHVMTTFYPLYYFSSEIGGDRAEVRMLVPDNTEPHSWEPRPSDVINMGRTDIFVYNGQGFEPWLDSFLSSVGNGDLILVDTSKNVGMHLSDEVRDLYDEAVEHYNRGPDSSIAAANSSSNAPLIDASKWEGERYLRFTFRRNGRIRRPRCHRIRRLSVLPHP